MNRRRKFTSVELAAFATGRMDGAAAFDAGFDCTPVLDPAAAPSMAALGNGHGLVLVYLNGWHRGWAEANVAEAVS